MRDPKLIEEILKRHLGRVTAPPIELQGELKPKPRTGKMLLWAATWAGAASLALLLIPWGGADRIRSADPAEVRAWVQARTGENFALRSGPPPEGVRLTGAYLTGASAVVTFAVAGRHGTVRVVPNAAGRHRYLVEAASAEDEKLACRLCHGTEVN